MSTAKPFGCSAANVVGNPQSKPQGSFLNLKTFQRKFGVKDAKVQLEIKDKTLKDTEKSIRQQQKLIRSLKKDLKTAEDKVMELKMQKEKNIREQRNLREDVGFGTHQGQI
jgi:chromosome segregation ATPase